MHTFKQFKDVDLDIVSIHAFKVESPLLFVCNSCALVVDSMENMEFMDKTSTNSLAT
jgi:hypothetical protein